MFLCLSDTGSPSLTFWRENYEKPGRSPRSYSLGSTGRTDSCSLSCERPDCSGTETGSSVEYRTSTDPTFDRTMRFPPNRHNTTSWFLRRKQYKKTIIERASRSDPIFNRKMRSTDSIQGFHPTSWFLRRNIINPRLGNSEKVIVSNAMLLTPDQTEYLVVDRKHLWVIRSP